MSVDVFAIMQQAVSAWESEISSAEARQQLNRGKIEGVREVAALIVEAARGEDTTPEDSAEAAAPE